MTDKQEEKKDEKPVPKETLRVHRVLYALERATDYSKELEAKCTEEHMKVEKKYRELISKANHDFSDLVNGEKEPSISDLEGFVEPKDLAVENDDKGIKHFWLKAIENCTVLSMMVEKKDRAALESLIDISTVSFEEKPCDEKGKEKLKGGFEIVFRFAQNDFFTNETLKKTIICECDLDLSGAIPVKEFGTKIDWKNGHCLTQNKTKKCQSFFGFFESNYSVADLEAFEEDIFLASTFKNHLTKNALDHYKEECNFVDQEDEEGFEKTGCGCGCGDEDEDDDEDEDEDELDDDENAGENPKKKLKFDAPKVDIPENEECKTQ